VREQGVVLEHGVDVPPEWRDARDILAKERHRPRGRLVEARDQPQAGGLAGTGGAEQREELAGGDRERDVVERADGAEGAADAGEFDRRRQLRAGLPVSGRP